MPWKQVTHAYHEWWHIFMVLYFEMHRLPWFTVKWKKALAIPEPFYAMDMVKLIYHHVSRLPKKQW